jgi:hypothetical protein
MVEHTRYVKTIKNKKEKDKKRGRKEDMKTNIEKLY